MSEGAKDLPDSYIATYVHMPEAQGQKRAKSIQSRKTANTDTIHMYTYVSLSAL